MTVEPSIYRSGDLLSPIAGNRYIDGAAPALRADEPLAPADQRHFRAVALGLFRRVGLDPGTLDEALARIDTAPSTRHGRVSRMQLIGIGHEVYCQPILQISSETWNVWVMEALCCSAVT